MVSLLPIIHPPNLEMRRRGRSGRGWSVQADHGGGRAGPGRSRPGESVRADHGGGRGARAGPGRGDEVRRVPASRPKTPSQLDM